MFVKTVVLLFLALSFVLDNVNGKPAVIDADSDVLGVCYSLKCPTDTARCVKVSETSEADKSKLLVQIKCYNQNDNILKSQNLTEDNPFGPNVYYKGSKYSVVVRLSSHYPDHNNAEDIDSKNELSHYPKAGNGPKSEVEDLNNN